MKKYFIKMERMGDNTYYFIYVRFFWLFEFFLERWNTPETAMNRLEQLNNTKQ